MPGLAGPWAARHIGGASRGALVSARGARKGAILLAGRCIGLHRFALKAGPKPREASVSRADASNGLVGSWARKRKGRKLLQLATLELTSEGHSASPTGLELLPSAPEADALTCIWAPVPGSSSDDNKLQYGVGGPSARGSEGSARAVMASLLSSGSQAGEAVRPTLPTPSALGQPRQPHPIETALEEQDACCTTKKALRNGDREALRY